MPKIAYCNDCNRYVQLSHQGECPDGHPRSALRDVRDGLLSDAPVIKPAIAARTDEEAIIASYDHWFAKVAGKAIIILPVAVILAWGIWSGMEEFSGSGMSWMAKLSWSLVSLAVTIGGAFFFSRMGRRRRR